MFGGKWRLRCESLQLEVTRLQQDKQAVVLELEALRSLQAQSQQEQQSLNSMTRYQFELHGKLDRFQESLSQTRDGVVGQANNLRSEVVNLRQNSGVFQETSALLGGFSGALSTMAALGVGRWALAVCRAWYCCSNGWVRSAVLLI